MMIIRLVNFCEANSDAVFCEAFTFQGSTNFYSTPFLNSELPTRKTLCKSFFIEKAFRDQIRQQLIHN